jgi:hypothetical protein
VSSAKHNLPFAGANEIPLQRDWALAPLTFMLAGLTSLVIEINFWEGYVLTFCIAVNCFLKYTAKLEGIFCAFIYAARQLEDNIGVTQRHSPKT